MAETSGMGASLRKGGLLGKEFTGSEGAVQGETAQASGQAQECPAHVSGENSTTPYVSKKGDFGKLGGQGHAADQ